MPQFDWIPTLVGAGTLALGSILTMVGQTFADRRARRREITARRDQLAIQLYQEDREVLHALQSALMETHEFMYRIAGAHVADQVNVDEPVGALMGAEDTRRNNDLYCATLPLFYRCRSLAVADAVKAYMDGCVTIQTARTHGELRAAWKGLNTPMQDAQQAIGHELRRTPLDDLGIAPWRRRWRERRRALKARSQARIAPPDKPAHDDSPTESS